MDSKLQAKLDNLFNKYKVKTFELVEEKNNFLKIEKYRVKLNFDDKVIYREKLVKNNHNSDACIIVPLFENNDLLMVVQPRVFTKKGVSLDFPSGYIEKNESLDKAALRELKEETGYLANKLELICSYYQDEGVSDALVYIFLARDLKRVSDLELDSDEYLEPIIINLNNVDELVEKEYIKSGGSQLAINRVKLLRREGKC